MLHTSPASALRSEELLDVLSDYERLLVVTHDNPDPDAIATGWAVQTLIQEKLRREARLIGGGAIVRAENQHMVELLQPPIELVDRIEAGSETGVILVDCSFGTTNQLLSRTGTIPAAVIDHHGTACARAEVPFCDVRPELAACTTIAASYLREQEVEPGTRLATAMVYAIRTETQGCETHFSRLDRSILLWLTERAEPGLIAEIENAPLRREYYGDLVLALQGTFLYDDAAFCLLPRADGPEIVGEVADLLIRCDGVNRVLCGAVIGNDLLISGRTTCDSENAALLLKRTLDGMGSCGGHDHRAGGKIAGVARKGRIPDELEDELRQRWLTACGIDRQRGTRLVARREIVGNL